MSGTLQSTPRSIGEDEEEILAVESVEPRRPKRSMESKRFWENEHVDASGRIRSMPDLEFRINADGEELAVTYDLRSGEISQRKVDEPRMDFSLRSFLLRLHVSHGYPSQTSARTVWAVIVDVTAALMIFWAVSGSSCGGSCDPLASTHVHDGARRGAGGRAGLRHAESDLLLTERKKPKYCFRCEDTQTHRIHQVKGSDMPEFLAGITVGLIIMQTMVLARRFSGLWRWGLQEPCCERSFQSSFCCLRRWG